MIIIVMSSSTSVAAALGVRDAITIDPLRLHVMLRSTPLYNTSVAAAPGVRNAITIDPLRLHVMLRSTVPQ